jgi:hypothetical protein
MEEPPEYELSPDMRVLQFSKFKKVKGPKNRLVPRLLYL